MLACLGYFKKFLILIFSVTAFKAKKRKGVKKPQGAFRKEIKGDQGKTYFAKLFSTCWNRFQCLHYLGAVLAW